MKNNKNTKNTKSEEVKVEKIDTTKLKSKETPSKGKTIIKKIFDVVFWVGIIVLTIIWVTDFVKVQQKQEPVFCLVKRTHEFKDGNVDECVGLGYKIYDYNRESINNVRQFSPFFIDMKK